MCTEEQANNIGIGILLIEWFLSLKITIAYPASTAFSADSQRSYTAFSNISPVISEFFLGLFKGMVASIVIEDN